MGLLSKQLKNLLSFSNSPKDLVDKVLKTDDFRLFIHDQVILPERIVDLVEPPAALYDRVYNGLADTLKIRLFPSSMVNQSNLGPFELAVLCPIVIEIKEQFKIST